MPFFTMKIPSPIRFRPTGIMIPEFCTIRAVVATRSPVGRHCCEVPVLLRRNQAGDSRAKNLLHEIAGESMIAIGQASGYVQNSGRYLADRTVTAVTRAAERVQDTDRRLAYFVPQRHLPLPLPITCTE